jgi:hypothetical protein
MLGGGYTLFNQVTTIASVFVGVWVYFDRMKKKVVEEEEGGEEEEEEVGEVELLGFSESKVWEYSFILVGTWVVLYGLMMYMLKRKYWSTFYSMNTGAYEIRGIFNDNEGDDEKRMQIFSYNPPTWKSIEPEVMKWSHENWGKWKNEAWFTEDLMLSVPDKYIPGDARAALDETKVGGRRQRRRSSLGVISLGEEKA